MSAATITIDEILAELDATPARGVEWHTAEEFAAAWGVSHRRALQILRKIKLAGRLEAGRGPREAVDGVSRPVQVYRIKSKAMKAIKDK